MYLFKDPRHKKINFSEFTPKNKEPKALYGLPNKVEFCATCVVSNQRPNSTIEYFTPCTLNNYRNYQASALLIFEAMKYAIDKNFKNWNWGGTWESQKGVYDFKKKWGSIDLNYYYFTKVYNPEILNQTSDKLLELYPNFYITSFSNLKNK